MTTNDSPTDDDESVINDVRFETWTDRRNGRAHLRADFSEWTADCPTLADQPDSTADESASAFDFEDWSMLGDSGIEVITLDYAYYTGSETVAPYPDEFAPDWALEAFRHHGYDVLAPDDQLDDDGELITDGGEDQFKVYVTISATLPKLGTKEYEFSMKVSDPSETDEAKENAKDVVPDNGTIDDIDVEVSDL